MFVVASTDEADVYETVADLGLPKVESRGVFQHWIEAWPLLDGAVTGISTEGFAPELPSGLRVLGHNPVRLLCHLMGMDPPRRALSGETAVPSVDDLLSRLATQREGGDADELTEQAKIAMVSRVFGLLNAVRVLPDGRNEHGGGIPADHGRWSRCRRACSSRRRCSSGCRHHSAVISATAIRAEDSSTIAFFVA